MNPQLQKYKTLKNKFISSNRFKRALNPWAKEIVSSYRLGMETISEDSKLLLLQIYKQQFNLTAKEVLKIDIREYKANEDSIVEKILKRVSRSIAVMFNSKAIDQTRNVSQTTNEYVKRTTTLAIKNGWGEREAKRALTNYVNNQKLFISLTDSAWAVEATRQTAILMINDPLKDTLRQISNLIQAENYNAANRLSREVVKLTKLPLSERQGEFVRAINDNRDRLMTPITQGEAIANLEKQANKLGATKKVWRISGFNTRETHENADGQTKNIDEPFELAGGLLQYPMDSSLGASLSEIINCNCYTEYE